MSIWTSLFTGASGLNAFGQALGVVGDNIANVSTVGYKSSRADFQDVLGGTGANGQRYGIGIRIGGPETLFGQGSISQTGRSLDLAIRGQGFFVVSGSHDGIPDTYYSRDGRVGFDAEGYLVNTEALRVQGYMFDVVTGTFAPVASDLRVDSQAPPRATAEVNLSANLDAAAVPPAAWDPTDPTGTSNYSTSITVFDSLGTAHRVDVYYRAQGAGGWEWHAMVDGGELTGGTAGTATEIANGTLTFDTNGALDTETTVASNADFVGATAGQAMAFDFGDSITTDAGTGLAGSTQFAAAFNVNAATQDGFSSGVLVDLHISEDGTMNARYSNGQSRSAARLALATFSGESGLQRAGNQLFRETIESGEPLVGAASSGSRGVIASGSLEGSNVDLGAELVTLIAYQRAFQANARTVTTADEMLAETANLKR